MDGGAALVAEFEMSSEEVGVKVGEEDVTDFEAMRGGVGEVALDVALGVDDDGRRARFVSEQIGGVRETSEVVLFQDHDDSLPAPRSGVFWRLYRVGGLIR